LVSHVPSGIYLRVLLEAWIILTRQYSSYLLYRLNKERTIEH